MSEPYPASAPLTPPEHEIGASVQYGQLVAEGLSQAQAMGFDLQAAITNNHADQDPAAVSERTGEVMAAATYLAESARLDAEFFARPVNAVLLTAIADSYVDNQKHLGSADTTEAAKAQAEKAMLEDILLIAAGDTSGYVRDMAVNDPEGADRYVETLQDPDEKAREEFYDSINDPELAAEVEAVLGQWGEGSLLEAERQAMNITAATEKPFTVKVLKMANEWELKKAGVEAMQPVEWPEYDPKASPEEMVRFRELSKEASRKFEEQRAFLAPYEAAENEYNARFGEKFGPLFQAFVNMHPDGRAELYLRAGEAHALVNYLGKKQPLPKDSIDRDTVERGFHTVQHEYAHTQKKLTMGRHIQLNMLFEERKAEMLAADKHGYYDIKWLMTDVANATGVDILGVLRDSLQQDDAPSALITQLANNLGTRTALLLTVAKPIPYEANPEHSRQFANLDHLKNADDASLLDMIVRDSLERKGDDQMLQAAARSIDSFRPEQLEYLRKSFFKQRRLGGLTHGTRYLEEALQVRLARESADGQTVVS